MTWQLNLLLSRAPSVAKATARIEIVQIIFQELKMFNNQIFLLFSVFSMFFMWHIDAHIEGKASKKKI